MKKYLIVLAVAGILCGFVCGAQAAIAVGEVTGNSWGVQWYEDGYVPGNPNTLFDTVALQRISGAYLEVPGVLNLPAGWTLTGNTSAFVLTTATPVSSLGLSSPGYLTTYWSDPAVATQYAYEIFLGGVQKTYQIWNVPGSNWPYYSQPMPAVTIKTANDDAAVPEPATLVIWSLLGAGSWLGMRRRGRQTAQQSWSPEARQAIHELIGR